MCGWRPCGCPCGFPAAVRGACGRVSTHAALGSFSFARRRNIGRERRQKPLAILAKKCYYEDRSLHVKRLFQWSLHPSRSPGMGTKLINLYKYYITKWCAYGLNAAVERRRAARQPLIPYRPASVFGSSENRREVSRGAPIRDRVGNEWVRDAVGESFTLFAKSAV